jgi:anti-sigma-K factor RskA
MAHEDFQQLIAPYSLAALDAAEESSVERHLIDCESCRQDLDEWRAMAAALSYATEPAEPSPALRERILKQVRQEGQFGSPPPENSSIKVAKIHPFVDQRRKLWTSIAAYGAVAASVAVMVLLIALYLLWRENRSIRIELAQLTEQIKATEAQLARERETVALLTSSGAQLASLAGTNKASTARATIAYDSSGRALLLAQGLPAAPPGMAYQLWFIVGNQKLPGKVFTPDAAGNGNLKDQVPAIAREGAVFAVTLEPAAGVSAPTGEIFLLSGT